MGASRLQTRPSSHRGARRAIATAGLAAAISSTALGGVAPAAAADAPAPPAGRDLITQQYLDFLSRAPDEAGLAFWNHQLDSGVHPATLIQSMAEQPEFESVVAPLVRLYVAYFLRSPDLAGLEFWIGRIRAGQGIESISQNFAGSAEFQNTYGALDDAAFIDLVYRNVLGRNSDDAGRAYWLEQMAGGIDRGRVMTAFSESAENRRATYGDVRATMLYVGMLDRAPEPEGLAYWAGLINGGTSYADVIAGFLESGEYEARLASMLTERNPLTGEATRAAANRTALAVKIDNVPLARPQTGLNQADIVFEEKGRGRSHSADRHLPVGRSRRRRSGALDPNDRFRCPRPVQQPDARRLRCQRHRAPAARVGAGAECQRTGRGNAYYRDANRRAPHNLFATTSRLCAIAPGPTSTPAPLFRYRPADAGVTNPASASTGVDIEFGRTSVSYRWDGARSGWVRRQDGTLHTEPGGAQVAPENVIVMTTDYAVSIADAESPEAITVGSGRVDVFTNGVVVTGTWQRPTVDSRMVLRDANGAEILLTPGETWVALAPAGTVAIR
ncbi:MAG: DUF4214 domain-containing protein [Acidimicrobiales bacterium]